MNNDVSLRDALLCVQRTWKLGDLEMAALSHVSLETFQGWGQNESGSGEPTLPPGMTGAMGVVSLHRKLSLRYPEAQDQIDWLTTSHKDFDGNKPMDVALSSPENLLWLSYYLESSPLPPKDIPENAALHR